MSLWIIPNFHLHWLTTIQEFCRHQVNHITDIAATGIWTSKEPRWKKSGAWVIAIDSDIRYGTTLSLDESMPYWYSSIIWRKIGMDVWIGCDDSWTLRGSDTNGIIPVLRFLQSELWKKGQISWNAKTYEGLTFHATIKRSVHPENHTIHSKNSVDATSSSRCCTRRERL